MNKKKLIFVCVWIFCILHACNAAFLPDISSYNDYGSKIAMNDIFLVEVKNTIDGPVFLIQFSPYDSTLSSLPCSLAPTNMTSHYVYTVVLGKNQTQFFFAGEFINGQNGTFMGVSKYSSSSSTCEGSFLYSLESLDGYKHQEYYVIAVESKGRLVYGFSNEFIYIYDSENNSIVNDWDGNLTWPDHSFMPHAVDFTDSFGVIAGLIRNPIVATSKYIPIIYLINFISSNGHPIIVHSYLPNATQGTWQDKLTNSGAEFYSPKYDMSVSIDTKGNVLVGMQFINRVFLFLVNVTKPTQLQYISRNTNDRSIGNGKAVAWLDNGIAAILVNTYTLSYQWLSSEVHFYDIQNDAYNTNSTPLSIFPNNHQLLPSRFSSILVNIVSSPSSLALLDERGNILIINPTPPGFYPAVNDTRLNPLYTVAQPCLAGTYKNRTGVHDCLLCPSRTKNPGNNTLQCIPCSANTFCSLGSVDEPPNSALEPIHQVRAYPKSPENTIYDEILIQNIFGIELGRCLLISPLFWTLIFAGLVIIMIIIMGILKSYTNRPRCLELRKRLKVIFKHADLINEGELWIGGLASFCVIILVSFAYVFSARFLHQYPLETSSDSYFSCDLSLRNAKFQTNIRSLSIPANKLEQEMINLLSSQKLILNVAFVNTKMDCDVISLQALYGTSWISARWLNCSNDNSILSLSIELAFQQISIRILMEDVQTIGALRVGLAGEKSEIEHYNRRKLYFYETFSRDGELLAQALPVNLELTKVINETLPLLGDESDFSGIYIPTFTMDSSSLFVTESQYIRSNSTVTTCTINIHETPYFVKNLQEPIAKTSEIIFHDLLFTMVCLEIFGLGFLLYKLVIKPIGSFFFPRQFGKRKKLHDNDGALTHVTCAF